MSGKILIDVPGIDRTIRANIISDLDPSFKESFLSLIKHNNRMTTDHTLSTGDYIIARGRPPRHPVRLGSQAAPLGKTELLCRQTAGSILYPGGNDLHFAYGPDNTEPLMARGPVVANVEDEYLEDFFRAGRLIWEKQYRTHELVIINVRSEGV